MARSSESQVVDDQILERAAAAQGSCSAAAGAWAEFQRRRRLGHDPICRLQGSAYCFEDREPGRDRGPPLALWRLAGSTAQLKKLRAEVLHDVAGGMARLAGSDPFDIEVGLRSRHGPVLATYETGPHQDLSYPRWTLHLCLAAGGGHRIACGSLQYPIRAGDLVLLDVHEVHSLDWTGRLSAEARGRRSPYVALAWDLAERPSSVDILGLIAPLFAGELPRLVLVDQIVKSEERGC